MKAKEASEPTTVGAITSDNEMTAWPGGNPATFAATGGRAWLSMRGGWRKGRGGKGEAAARARAAAAGSGGVEGCRGRGRALSPPVGEEGCVEWKEEGEGGGVGGGRRCWSGSRRHRRRGGGARQGTQSPWGSSPGVLFLATNYIRLIGCQTSYYSY